MKDASLATVAADGTPRVRIIDVILAKRALFAGI
jgi:uncharacterized pyridoxamine 5'-phosphate oxidase family protein